MRPPDVDGRATTLVLIELRAVRYALTQSAVREILPLPRLWRPRALPRPLAGFVNLAGVAVPVLALGRLLGPAHEDDEPAERNLYAHLILVNGLEGKRPAALLVDRVLDVVPVPASRLTPADRAEALNGCVEAEVELDGSLVPLLAVERILLAEERQALADLSRRAQERIGEWTGT